MISVGTVVRFVRLPDWVSQLPEESERVFRFCLNRDYRVSEIDSNGLLVLDVSQDIDHRFGGFQNDLRLEEKFVEPVATADGRGSQMKE
ncbi:MAG: hypothetical protein KDM64_19080 [Verrucomicrobiae bacterium]|nr:hypothetical protein [Verrucomicrobiae bacterium]